TFGGPITSRTGSIFVAIADHEFLGLGYLLRMRLMQKFPHLAQFNSSSDTGREGLAHVKSRFRPIAMNNLYQATRSEEAVLRLVSSTFTPSGAGSFTALHRFAGDGPVRLQISAQFVDEPGS